MAALSVAACHKDTQLSSGVQDAKAVIYPRVKNGLLRVCTRACTLMRVHVCVYVCMYVCPIYSYMELSRK